ncbi:RAD51-associated protein 1 isoform X2 [Trichomycterus rosablanca]|uniref:RAD51-associated protein 1 isoform X2 n=1 Tax=Trichomycterus rosablanca TaxID=2290929 RepID=UPI002F36044A
MDRTPRCKKTVNYSDFLGDSDDEDFATVKAPPNKKACASQHVKIEKETIDVTVKECKERVPLDDRKYQRDLESALALSLFQTFENAEHDKSHEDLPPVLTHFREKDLCLDGKPNQPQQDLPPLLSNCSVDVTCFGLDEITSEQPSTPASCKEKKSQKATGQQRRVLAEINDSKEDEDYKPQNTPESDSEFSDQDESDDEFTVKKKGGKNKTSKSEKQKSCKSAKKEKKPLKPQKAKSQPTARNKALSSPTVEQSVPALRQTPTTPPMRKNTLYSSPAGGKVPKWTPPVVVYSLEQTWALYGP